MTTSIHHLDTSALTKLLLWPHIQEKGSKELYDFFQENLGLYTFDLVIGETLNVIKQMAFSTNSARRVLSPNGYAVLIETLRMMTKPSHSLHVEVLDMADDDLCREAMKLVKQFKIDFVDALVVVAPLRIGPWSPGQNLLITADEEMVKAADSLKIPTWNCVRPFSIAV